VVGAQTYFANISESLSWTRPVWQKEYDTREEYSTDKTQTEHSKDETTASKKKQKHAEETRIQWPSTSPLNATFWHAVTTSMLDQSQSQSPHHSNSNPKSNSEPGPEPLLSRYNRFETKSSAATIHRGNPDLSAEQKICFLRAGSGALGRRCRDIHGGADARGERERAVGVV
jgi:hypothetical protein